MKQISWWGPGSTLTAHFINNDLICYVTKVINFDDVNNNNPAAVIDHNLIFDYYNFFQSPSNSIMNLARDGSIICVSNNPGSLDLWFTKDFKLLNKFKVIDLSSENPRIISFSNKKDLLIQTSSGKLDLWKYIEN